MYQPGFFSNAFLQHNTTGGCSTACGHCGSVSGRLASAGGYAVFVSYCTVKIFREAVTAVLTCAISDRVMYSVPMLCNPYVASTPLVAWRLLAHAAGATRRGFGGDFGLSWFNSSGPPRPRRVCCCSRLHREPAVPAGGACCKVPWCDARYTVCLCAMPSTTCCCVLQGD